MERVYFFLVGRLVFCLVLGFCFVCVGAFLLFGSLGLLVCKEEYSLHLAVPLNISPSWNNLP